MMNKLINIKGISFYYFSEFNKVIDDCINVLMLIKMLFLIMI